jgi:hypothetical protein
MATPNQSNVDDRPWMWYFIIYCLMCFFYMLYRALCVTILRRQQAMRHSASRHGHAVRILLILLPLLYPIMMLIRTASRTLNNECAYLLPLSIMWIFFNQQALLTYQLQAIVPSFFERLVIRYRNCMGRMYLLLFLVLSLPSIAFVIATIALQSGVQLEGVCTFAGDPIPWLNNVSVWSFLYNANSGIFILINFAAEVRLRQSVIHILVKRELLVLTRMHLVWMVLDVVFRYGVVKQFIFWVAGPDGQSGAATANLVWSLLFVMSSVFVNGAGNAMVLAQFDIAFLGMSPFRARFWRLAWGSDRYSEAEMAALAAAKMAANEEHLRQKQKGKSGDHVQEQEKGKRKTKGEELEMYTTHRPDGVHVHRYASVHSSSPSASYVSASTASTHEQINPLHRSLPATSSSGGKDLNHV